jgi:carboxy-cis,cis-muconate cyclase
MVSRMYTIIIWMLLTNSVSTAKGELKENYWSAEVMLAPSGRYVWATSRGKRNTEFYGYISCFLLDSEGMIVKRMFMVPTTTKAGWANAISPAFWNDEYAAMADYPDGYVQIWKMEGKKETENGIEYTTATAIARVDIGDGGCCANAIWYS